MVGGGVQRGVLALVDRLSAVPAYVRVFYMLLLLFFFFFFLSTTLLFR